ncbi:hypothetical protein [Streptomyces sp. GbtcB6]|nr:hypothetical protein [Streptomyces sp. GbtcB6]
MIASLGSSTADATATIPGALATIGTPRGHGRPRRGPARPPLLGR